MCFVDLEKVPDLWDSYGGDSPVALFHQFCSKSLRTEFLGTALGVEGVQCGGFITAWASTLSGPVHSWVQSHWEENHHLQIWDHRCCCCSCWKDGVLSPGEGTNPAPNGGVYLMILGTTESRMEQEIGRWIASAKGRVAAGFCSNPATAQQIWLI